MCFHIKLFMISEIILKNADFFSVCRKNQRTALFSGISPKIPICMGFPCGKKGRTGKLVTVWPKWQVLMRETLIGDHPSISARLHCNLTVRASVELLLFAILNPLAIILRRFRVHQSVHFGASC